MEQQPDLTLVSTPEDDIEVEYITEVLKKDYNLFENEEERKKREEVLISLKKFLTEVIKNKCITKGKNDKEAKSAGGGVFPFESYRLGIVGPGDDIDVLCVTPAIDTRENNI